jgi:hypothetical protein
MKRSTSYSLIFIFFIIIILINILALGQHHVEVEEKCEKLEVTNDSLQITIDTIYRK